MARMTLSGPGGIFPAWPFPAWPSPTGNAPVIVDERKPMTKQRAPKTTLNAYAESLDDLRTLAELAQDLQNATDQLVDSRDQFDVATGDLQQSETEFKEAKDRLMRALNGR